MFHNPDLKVEMPTLPNVPAPMPACADAVVGRRPRIAIMGEFSAGKSTLTNMLVGSNALPMKVTATQLPPVWLSHGTGTPYGVDLTDRRFEVDFDRIDRISLAETQYLRVENPASVLELCDLIDFPGISDPNMPAEVWQRTAGLADAVIWCTHAIQAWRQSEAAAWEEMPPAFRSKSFLLLTRFDRLTDERDRRRVMARVRHETEGLFAHVFPVSLTRALAAGEDRTAWEASGAEDVMSALLDLVMGLSGDTGAALPGLGERLSRERIASPDEPEAAPVNRIVPRRVSVKGTARRHARPSASAADLGAVFRLS